MKSKEIIHKSWIPIINAELYKQPLQQLNENILPNISYQPEPHNIFKVFEMPLDKIKVVILGQEPYVTPNNAIGKAFAVFENARIPVSLRNIHKEIADEYIDDDGYFIENEISHSFVNMHDEQWKTLEHWSKQGVFLLNTALTVETGKAGSHLKYWEEFTKRIISFISSQQPCIWVLWGAKAQKFKPYILKQFKVQGYDLKTIKYIPGDSQLNYLLTAPHPITEAYSNDNIGFYGCNHFLFINEILNKTRQTPINW